jgi:hypothetical protein
MPILAPLDRPSGGSAEMPLPVGSGPSAHKAVRSTDVQLCVTAQHPPPRDEAQVIWLDVQPAGISLARLVEVLVELVATHWLLGPQIWPYEQHPPPSEAGQANMDVCVHCLPQHAGTTVVVVCPRLVMVLVLLH